MLYKTEIEGHTYEVRSSESGSLNPWSWDYVRDKNINLMCSDDMAEFLLEDGDTVYRIDGDPTGFTKLTTIEEAKAWMEYNTTYACSLKESIQALNKLNEKTEALRKMIQGKS